MSNNEQILLKNHVIKANQQSQKLLTQVSLAINDNLLVNETYNHANSLKNLLVRLTGFIMRPIDNIVEIRNLYNKVAGEFNTLHTNYIIWDNVQINVIFNPIMKAIQDSLAFINKMVVKLEGLARQF